MLFHYMAQVRPVDSSTPFQAGSPYSDFLQGKEIYDILYINIRFSCKNGATVNGPKFYCNSLQHTKHTLIQLCCIPVLWYRKPAISVFPLRLLPYEIYCISSAFKLPDNGT